MQGRCGFTLLELLVVISIIGILTSLLLTALSQTKFSAQQIKCQSNVQQLIVASASYLGDNGKYAAKDHPSFPGGVWMATLKGYTQNDRLLLCPSAPLKEPPPRSGNRTGTANQAWVRWTEDVTVMFVGSYGYNGWLYSDMKFPDSNDFRQPLVFTSESLINHPSLTPLFFDENWVDAWPLETDLPSVNLYAGNEVNNSKSLSMGRCTIARHDNGNPSKAPQRVGRGQRLPGAIDMGMVDGHVEPVKLEALWNCYWHVNWQPSATPPTR